MESSGITANSCMQQIGISRRSRFLNTVVLKYAIEYMESTSIHEFMNHVLVFMDQRAFSEDCTFSFLKTFKWLVNLLF